MKILVTGGAGFIGSHLVEKLVAQGNHVIIVDNLSTGSLANIETLLQNERVSLLKGSILNETLMGEVISKVDQVYHLAAIVGVKYVMENPLLTIQTNVRGTEIILQQAYYYQVKVLIASSSEVYGNHDGEVLQEGFYQVMGPAQKRRWCYACSKALDEHLALAYYKDLGLKPVVVRLFNTVGPRQTGRYGMVLPNFVQSALANKPIRVFGDGNQTRCFCHVSDVVNGLVRLMNTSSAIGKVFNIGNDQEVTINYLAERVRELLESQSEIVHIPFEEIYGPEFEEPRRRRPSLLKIRECIDYQPQHDLDSIIRSVEAYYTLKH